MVIRRLLILGLAVCGLVLNGCRADKQRGTLGTRNSSNALSLSSSSGTSGATPSFASDPKYQKLLKELSNPNQKTSTWDKAIAPVESVGGKLKQAAEHAVQKMRPKPRVVDTDDPVSLSSKPVKIGPDVYCAAGRLAEHNGNVEEALKQYKHALKISPKHVPTLISLGRLYDRQGLFDKAISQYRQAIAADPNNATAHNDMGLCLSRHGQLNEAVTELRRAVKIAPEKKLYHNNLATVLVEMGRQDEAWRELSRALPPAVAHYNLGYLLNRAGKKEEARRQFALAYQADTSLAVAKTMLDQLDAELGRRAPAVAARPDSVSSHKMSLRKKRRTKPHRFVSMSGPGHLRRIPAPDPATPAPSAPASVPGQPTPNAGAPVVQPPVRPAVPPRQLPAAAPATPKPSLRFPVRPTSGFISDDPDLDAQLPTPKLLEKSSLKPAHPDLMPPPAHK